MIEIDKFSDSTEEPIDRLISAESKSTQEEAIERALRPKRLADYVGQVKIREQLQGHARSRAAVRPARSGQDHAGAHHRH